MIGWINLSVEAFIRESFGDDTWVTLVQKARACAAARAMRRDAREAVDDDASVGLRGLCGGSVCALTPARHPRHPRRHT
jgi:hypothetical protein